MEQGSDDSNPTVEPHLAPAEDVHPSNKADILALAFEYMRAGSTLNHAALHCGYSPATVWRWLHEDAELISEYEKLKNQRSRALIEHAIYELQAATDLNTIKMAERRAKYYLLLAAKLNPTEFSDRMHSPTGKGVLGKGQVSFVLNIGNAHAHVSRELQVIEQPEDGELP